MILTILDLLSEADIGVDEEDVSKWQSFDQTCFNELSELPTNKSRQRLDSLASFGHVA